MPLEFALRPRFNLERPPPRRRLGWLRLPPLALPIAAYWLGIAGVTHVLLRVAAVESSSGGAEVGVTSRSSEIAETRSSDTALIPTTPSPTADSHPLPRARAAEEEQPLARALESAPAPQAPAAQRPSVSLGAPPPVAHAERGAPQRTVSVEPVEEPAQTRSETPKAGARQDDPPRSEVQTASLPSCESAAASANETIDFRAARGAPDLTRNAFAHVLENGAYFTHCALPARTALEICAAVRDGKVVGVSVTTEPRDSAISACVRRAVAALSFPRSSRLDVTRTRFEPSL